MTADNEHRRKARVARLSATKLRQLIAEAADFDFDEMTIGALEAGIEAIESLSALNAEIVRLREKAGELAIARSNDIAEIGRLRREVEARISPDWVIGYFPADVAEEVKRAVRDAFGEWNALSPKPAPAMPNGVEARRHAANEWADMATNGVQWLRNIRDGVSTVDEALAEMESNMVRVRALNDEAQHMPLRAADNRDAAVPAGEAVAVCGTCNGVGMIGGHRGQTPDSFEQWAEDCPDCTPQPADGEAVALAVARVQRGPAPHDALYAMLLPEGPMTPKVKEGDPLYLRPPAPVQAAPQEVEKAAATLRDALKYVGYRQDGDLNTLAERAELWMRESKVLIAMQQELTAHPSACELGAVVSANRDKARLDYMEKKFSGCTNRERYLPVQMLWGVAANGRTLREACDKYMARDGFQHRGDSRGGEASGG